MDVAAASTIAGAKGINVRPAHLARTGIAPKMSGTPLQTLTLPQMPAQAQGTHNADCAKHIRTLPLFSMISYQPGSANGFGRDTPDLVSKQCSEPQLSIIRTSSWAALRMVNSMLYRGTIPPLPAQKQPCPPWVCELPCCFSSVPWPCVHRLDLASLKRAPRPRGSGSYEMVRAKVQDYLLWSGL
jgi:hypothetical protein